MYILRYIIRCVVIVIKVSFDYYGIRQLVILCLVAGNSNSFIIYSSFQAYDNLALLCTGRKCDLTAPKSIIKMKFLMQITCIQAFY